MNEFSIHSVASIKTIACNYSDFVVKQLIVTDSNGVETTITLFANSTENLKIANPKFKDVK